MKSDPKQNRMAMMLALTILAFSIGLGRAFIDGKISVLSIIFTLIGALGFISFCIRTYQEKIFEQRHFPFQRLKSILLILALGLILFDVNFLAHQFNKRWDITTDQQHTLSQETLHLINNMQKKIKLSALVVGIPPKYLEDLLKEYALQSKHQITFEIIDPILEIGYAAQFGNVINGKESKVIVQSGQERKDVDFSDAPLSEEQLNNAILNVTRKSRRVYFLTGHQEYRIDDESDSGIIKFSEYLRQNNFQVSQLVIGSDNQVPDDCDVLVIAGPKDDLTKHEEEAIQLFLEKGGDAFIMVENTVVTTPDKPLTKLQENKNPSLNNVLRPWGVEVANDIVVDLANHAGDDVGSPATKSYMTHRAIVKELDYTFYIRPRSILMLQDRKPTVKLAPLVLTESEDKSWGETNRTLEVKYNEGIDREGPVPIAYVISEPQDIKKKSATRLIVFTDADFLTNAYIDSYSNAEMGLNVVSWLTDLDYQPLMGKKNMEVPRLDLTSRQKRQVIVVLVFLPVLVLLAGMMVWINKK